MRKWKCIKGHGKDDFIVGNIYESNDKGYGFIGGDGFVYDGLRYDGFTGVAFGEVKEEGEKVNKFKVGDKVRIIARKSGHRFKIGDIVELYEKSYDGDFRGMKEGDSRDWGNWIRQEDMELIKENKSSIKTLTITTSDSTTTLTDGTHTTTINRYYADKHDERNAISIVIDKYYDELAKIERVSKLPKVGDKVKVINNGRTHSTYDEWLIKNNVNLKSAIKWKIGLFPENGGEYVIKEIHKHERYDADLALIEDAENAYIINIKGLEVIK